MLRKEIRRRERRALRRSRFIAGITAIAIGIGLAAGGTVVATANTNKTLSKPVVNAGGITTYNQNGLVCSSNLINFQKPAAIDGSNLDGDGLYQAVNPNDWGTIQWDVSERRVTWTIKAGWDVDICVKGGTHLTVIDTSAVGTTSYVHTYAGLSHLGFRINSVPPLAPEQRIDCTTVTFVKKAALANGDHINMTITPPGGQINVQVDRNIPGGFNGLGLRVTAFDVAQPVIPLTEQQVTSGILSFSYAGYITASQWTVSFVQTDGIDTWPNLVCGDLPTENLVTPAARMVDITCTAPGSYTLDRVTGIRWFVDGAEVQPGRYEVATAGTVVARAEAIAPDYGIEPGAQTEFTFVFRDPTTCTALDLDLRLTYMEECAPDSTYTFRVRNPHDVAVPYTYTVYGRPDLSGSGIAARADDSFFNLSLSRTDPSVSFTVILQWGDGRTVEAEQETRATGRDKVCSIEVAPVVDLTCASPGSYTVPDVLGVRWSLNGEAVLPGRYEVRDAGSVTLRASVLNRGYVFSIDGVLSTSDRLYTLTFSDPGPCIDPSFNGATTTTSECLRDVPWITYSVVVDDPNGRLTSNAAKLIFVDPLDPDRTHEVALGTVTPGVPLTGRVLWPGASVDADGNPTGWPGWTQAGDGTWVETAYGDNFRWARGITEVTLSVNPTMQIAVSYPPPSALCVSGPTEIEPVATKASCLTHSAVGYDLPPIDGVTWFVNGEQRAAGFHPVFEAQSVSITFDLDENHPAGPFGLKADAPRSFDFEFTTADIDCQLVTSPITNVKLEITKPTCDVGETLNVAGFIFDEELARLAAPPVVNEDGTYTVVFTAIGERTTFDQSPDVTAPGRTVSNGGKTLTFTGTLEGPDRSTACVTTVELRDPVSFVDSCLGASFTIYFVEGIVYTVYRDDETPFVVDWAEGELTRTYVADQGERVRIIPSAESDRYTISPDPAPFERTFATFEGDCLPTLPLVEGSATFTPASCLDTTNWLTLANVEGVQWWVDGTKAAPGTWPSDSGEVLVAATPLAGFGFAPEAQTRWVFEGIAVGDDCLPTLALTGTSTASLWLGGSALLMLLVGTGLLVFRRRHAD